MDFQNQKYMYYHIKQGTRYNLHKRREETEVLKSSVVDSEWFFLNLDPIKQTNRQLATMGARCSSHRGLHYNE